MCLGQPAYVVLFCFVDFRRDLHTWNNRGVRVFLWTVNEPLEKLHICENMHCSYLTDTLDGDVLNHATA